MQCFLIAGVVRYDDTTQKLRSNVFTAQNEHEAVGLFVSGLQRDYPGKHLEGYTIVEIAPESLRQMLANCEGATS